MPKILEVDHLGRPTGRFLWVSKHSAAAQPSARAVKKREARAAYMEMLREGRTQVEVKPERRRKYLNSAARFWDSLRALMAKRAYA